MNLAQEKGRRRRRPRHELFYACRLRNFRRLQRMKRVRQGMLQAVLLALREFEIDVFMRRANPRNPILQTSQDRWRIFALVHIERSKINGDFASRKAAARIRPVSGDVDRFCARHACEQNGCQSHVSKTHKGFPFLSFPKNKKEMGAGSAFHMQKKRNTNNLKMDIFETLQIPTTG